MRSLYCCLWVPDFAAAALAPAERRAPPTIVVRGKAPNRFVHAVNEAARRRGAREGMPAAEAEARLQSVERRGARILDRDPEAERRARRRLLDLALTVSPRFEDAGPGLVLVDLAGLPDPHGAVQRLFDGAEKLGLPARAGVSRNRFAAVCAARTQPGVTHIHPGQEAGFLESRPLEALPLEAAERETLKRWGIRRIGDLARLPEDDLTARFGERGARLRRLARGEDEVWLDAHAPPPEFEERRDFDWEMGEIEPLSFELAGLLDRLCAKLRERNLAAASIAMSLQLAGGGSFERKVDLARPLTDPRALLTLARLDLAAHPPGDAITGARVTARPVEARRTQLGLFAPQAPSPEKLATTLARLANLVGEQRVGAPVALDTHRPGAAAIEVFQASSAPPEPPPLEAAPAEPSLDRRAVTDRLRLVPRVLRPPWPARVVSNDGRPVYVDAGEIEGPVATLSGPWMVAGEWWTEEGWEYEEWDVEIREKLYRLCRGRGVDEWCVTSEYD